MDIYIKPEKKIPLFECSEILLGDICHVSAPKDIYTEIKNLRLMSINSGEKKNYLISVLDIINTIKTAYPELTVINVGETDSIVIYAPKKHKKNFLLHAVKIFFVTIILFAGSATAIMSFHSDAQMPEIFKTYYKIFFGEEKETPLIIDIPYSIGLAVGIIVFYNHFAGKKISDDPTPIQVELSVYDTDVTDTLINQLSNQEDNPNE